MPSNGQQSGRLSYSEFLSSLDSCEAYLSEGQHSDVRSLFQFYPTLFSDLASRTKVLENNIDVGAACPIKQHAYRCPIEREKMKKSAT